MARTQPFRDLLARAFEDGDDDLSPLRSMEQAPQEPAPREQTRADRGARFSGEHPFAIDMSMDRSLDGFDNLNDLHALPSLEELELEDLEALDGALMDELEPVDDDTVHDASIPTRPFDLQKLAELAAGPTRRRRKKRRPSPLVSRSAEAEAAPLPVPDGPQLKLDEVPTGALPVAIGQSTQAWRHVNGDLRPVVIEPLMRPAPVDLPQEALQPLGDGFPLEHLDAIAGEATPEASPVPTAADPLKRAVTMLQPNHRQKNTAESFYALALEALGQKDRRMAVTHLRTAAALDPTEERYRLMIADLSDKKPDKGAPRLPPVKPLSQVQLPVVRGRPT